jgi:hypothetical protein
MEQTRKDKIQEQYVLLMMREIEDSDKRDIFIKSLEKIVGVEKIDELLEIAEGCVRVREVLENKIEDYKRRNK